MCGKQIGRACCVWNQTRVRHLNFHNYKLRESNEGWSALTGHAGSQIISVIPTAEDKGSVYQDHYHPCRTVLVFSSSKEWGIRRLWFLKRQKRNNLSEPLLQIGCGGIAQLWWSAFVRSCTLVDTMDHPSAPRTDPLIDRVRMRKKTENFLVNSPPSSLQSGGDPNSNLERDVDELDPFLGALLFNSNNWTSATSVLIISPHGGATNSGNDFSFAFWAKTASSFEVFYEVGLRHRGFRGICCIICEFETKMNSLKRNDQLSHETVRISTKPSITAHAIHHQWSLKEPTHFRLQVFVDSLISFGPWYVIP